MHYRHNFIHYNKFVFFGKVRLGFLLNYLNLIEDLNIYNVNSDSNSSKFWNESYIVLPEIGVEYRITSRIKLNLCIGAEKDFNTYLRFKYNSDIYLNDVNRSKVNADWSGFRSELGISYSF